MFTTLKIAVTAAALAILPAVTSAAPLLLNEGGSTLIAIENTYSYAETGITAGPDSRTFTLEATPPTPLGLSAEFTTLEFVGVFNDLEITLTNNLGTFDANMTSMSGTSRLFDLSTVFNAVNGFTQLLTISWSSVSESQTGILMQAEPTTVPEVPVPAAGLLLLTAVGGVAALRRRKKA